MLSWGILLSLLAAISTAGSHVMAKFCCQSLNLRKFLWIRTTAAFVALFTVALLTKNLFSMAEVKPLFWLIVAVSGAISPLLIGIVSFWALGRTSVNIRMPILSSYPLFVILLSWMFLEEKLTIFTILGAVIIFLGVIGVSLQRVNSAEANNKYRKKQFLPIVASCGGSFLMAINVILWKIFSSQWGFSALNIMLLQTFMAASILTVIMNFRKINVKKKEKDSNVSIIVTIASGFLVFGVANIALITAMDYITTAVVSSIVCSNILFIGIFAKIYFKERWSPTQFVGALSICVGIVILSIF